jgi:hypothetical protein
MKLIATLFLSLVLIFAMGCASFEMPDGSQAKVFGQSSVRYCQMDGGSDEMDKSQDKATDPTDELVNQADTKQKTFQKVNCVEVTGGALSGGVTDVLGDALKLPGALIRGAAAGLP